MDPQISENTAEVVLIEDLSQAIRRGEPSKSILYGSHDYKKALTILSENKAEFLYRNRVEFKEELTSAFSSLIPTNTYETVDGASREGDFGTWLIVLITTASTAVATSILSEIGKDIYTRFKSVLPQRKGNKNHCSQETLVERLEKLKTEEKDFYGVEAALQIQLQSLGIVINAVIETDSYNGLLVL